MTQDNSGRQTAVPFRKSAYQRLQVWRVSYSTSESSIQQWQSSQITQLNGMPRLYAKPCSRTLKARSQRSLVALIQHLYLRRAFLFYAQFTLSLSTSESHVNSHRNSALLGRVQVESSSCKPLWTLFCTFLACLSPSMASSAIYRDLLLKHRHGLPLWIPDPDENLEEHKKQGISIGDLGLLTEDGGFEYLFNIHVDADHSVNKDMVIPPSFTPLPLPRTSKHAYHDQKACITQNARFDIGGTIAAGVNLGYVASH
jgi:hypothetical protein